MSDEKDFLAEIGKCFLFLFFVIIPGLVLLACCFDRMKNGIYALLAFILIGGVYLWIANNVLRLIVDAFAHISWGNTENDVIRKGAGHLALMLAVILAMGAPSAGLGLAANKILPEKKATATDTASEAESEKDSEESYDETPENTSSSADDLVTDSVDSSETESDNLDWAPIEEYQDSPEQNSYVYVTPTGSCYHTLNCPTLSHTKKVKPYSLGNVPTEYSNCQVCDPLQYD